MDKVFGVELSGRNDYYCLLDLPATDYELLDALERLQMPQDDKPNWEIIEHSGFQYLHVHLIGECDLYQLNALASRLGQLNSSEKTAFECLFNMEIAKKNGPISISTMIDLAYNTDCCHVVEGVTTDAQLGKFYAENGFIPELDNLPDKVFQMLDFDQLGKKMRFEEGGILVNGGYVTQHTELKQFYDKLILEPQRPEYTLLLGIGRYPYDTNDQPDKLVYLELPATETRLTQALEETEAASWDEVVFQVEDSAIPGLFDDMDSNGISELNELAQAIAFREKQEELPKLKAVLHAVQCLDGRAAITIAENLDDYFYESNQRTAKEVAIEELKFSLDEKSRSILQKHVNLFSYGQALIAENNASLTPYGLVERKDGQPIHSIEHNAHQIGTLQMG